MTSVKRGGAAGRYYFPVRLKKRLAMIPRYPVTVVEAPSGFGKTTAVREYLRKHSPSKACVRWYTCLGEPPRKAWEGICRLFDGCGELARRLAELFPPAMENLPDIAALMREQACRGCEAESFLVIDNYQLFENEIPAELIHALSVHACEKRHVIVVTQPLPPHKKREETVHNANIHRLTARDFYFDEESTAGFCRLRRIKLSSEEVGTLHSLCGGWISALRLQADNYRETGTFMTPGDMDSLIEAALLHRLTNAERDFLTALSLLGSFTAKQAAIVGSWPALPRSVVHLLEGNFFIPCIAEQAGQTDANVYSMHGLLRDYLLKRCHRQSAEFVECANRRAGEACLAVGDYLGAARFYLAAEDYDAALAIPYTPLYMSEVKEQGALALMERLVGECGEETLLKYPFAMIQAAFQFLQSGKRSEFEKMRPLLQKFLDGPEPSAMPEEVLSQVRGETATLLSFTAFNDIERMSRYHREALSYLNGKNGAPRTMVFGTTPWTFGVTSVLYMFWSRAGELDRELAAMDECLPHYLRLSGGHGTGAESAFRAEASLVRGDDAAAESLALKALYFARGENQHSICLCAELILGRVAVLRGDEKMFGLIRQNMEKYAEGAGRALRRMTELAVAALDAAAGRMDDFPEWLRDVESIRKALLVQGHSYGLMLHERWLLQEGRHSELYALNDVVTAVARAMNYLLPQVYHAIYLAVAKEREGKRREATLHLGEALSLALPDGVRLPFAEFGADLLPLLEAARECGAAAPEVFGPIPAIAAIVALAERQTLGASAIAVRLSATPRHLTAREREIALLAKEGFKTREIASRLFISEHTVNTTLRKIFAKLDVHSRQDLAGRDF